MDALARAEVVRRGEEDVFVGVPGDAPGPSHTDNLVAGVAGTPPSFPDVWRAGRSWRFGLAL